MVNSSVAEFYFIAAMMILILLISTVAVFFFVRQYKKEKREKPLTRRPENIQKSVAEKAQEVEYVEK
jgi:hypothetical protein